MSSFCAQHTLKTISSPPSVFRPDVVPLSQQPLRRIRVSRDLYRGNREELNSIRQHELDPLTAKHLGSSLKGQSQTGMLNQANRASYHG